MLPLTVTEPQTSTQTVSVRFSSNFSNTCTEVNGHGTQNLYSKQLASDSLRRIPLRKSAENRIRIQTARFHFACTTNPNRRIDMDTANHATVVAKGAVMYEPLIVALGKNYSAGLSPCWTRSLVREAGRSLHCFHLQLLVFGDVKYALVEFGSRCTQRQHRRR